MGMWVCELTCLREPGRLPKELYPPESPEFCEMIEDFGKWKVLYERTLMAIRKTYKAMGELVSG